MSCFVWQTVLAAIVMVNLMGMFRQFRDICTLWRTSKIELVSLSLFQNVRTPQQHDLNWILSVCVNFYYLKYDSEIR